MSRITQAPISEEPPDQGQGEVMLQVIMRVKNPEGNSEKLRMNLLEITLMRTGQKKLPKMIALYINQLQLKRDYLKMNGKILISKTIKIKEKTKGRRKLNK